MSEHLAEAAVEQRRARFFRDTGYLRVLGVLGMDETAALKEFVHAEHAEEPATAERLGKPAPGKLYGLYDRNKALMHPLVSHPKIVAALDPILGPHKVFVKNRHNHATVNTSQTSSVEAGRLHRDILNPTRGLVTAAVYLEDATVENGCTWIVPGSDRLSYVGVPQVDGGGTWMADHPDEYGGLLDQALPCPMEAGSVLLFNGLAFHSVGQNTTPGTRTSITLGYRSTDELQALPDVRREVLVSGRYLYLGNDRPPTA